MQSFGGGKIVYIKDGSIAKRLEDYETATAETIWLELNISNKKWFIVYAYRPESINRNLFFSEINTLLSKATNEYENIVISGDLNINLDIPSSDIKGYLTNICDNFNLTNLVNKKTCTKTYDGTSIDVIMTTRPLCFHNTSVIETSLSDHHKLIMTFLKSRFQRLPST